MAKTKIVNRQLLIDGKWQNGSDGAWLDVVNPVDETVVAKVAVATTKDLDDAISAATRAFAKWSRVSAYERSKILRLAAENIRENHEEISRDLTAEQGKPYTESVQETLGCADIVDWYAEEGRRAYGRIIPSRQERVRQSVLLQPVGPVAAFTPWNFPLSQAARKIGAALAAGCSIVIKAPEETPSCVAGMVQAFLDAGTPEGLVNLVFGVPATISEYLISSPAIRKFSFTGSVPVGKRLAALAGTHMKASTMELGGHAPVLVFDDFDPARAAQVLASAKYRNAGQICASPTRFYVQKDVFSEFTQKFVSHANDVKVGDGMQPDTQMGPLANTRRVDAVDNLVADATNRGAQILAGGKRIGNRGYFFEPTVLESVSTDSRIMQDEPFGPVAIMMPFEDADEAINRANDTGFGLAAYAFTSSSKNVALVEERLKAGVMGINSMTIGLAETPFGGVDDSGYGREGGSEGLAEYLHTKYVGHLMS